MILDEILEHKRSEVEGRKDEISLADVMLSVAGTPIPRGFATALHLPEQGQRRGRIAKGEEPESDPQTPRLIAEIKGRSPSKGTIRKEVDAASIASDYVAGGASCISVLTDTRFFAGALERIPEVQEAVDVPVLQKDFIIDPYQIFEARGAGADCILLIVSALPESLLAELYGVARELGMDVLVEVHDREELETALKLESGIIGINNRNLKTFEVSISNTEELAPLVPEGRILVGESGISTREDVLRMAKAGVDALLIGESLMSSSDIQAKVRELFG